MNNFKELTELSSIVQHVIPLVVDNSLSYYELLAKVTEKVNVLISNQNNFPAYLKETIENYIQSGEINEVVQNVLNNFIVNVQNPPLGLERADNTGTIECTKTIQGCIDYLYSRGGGCIYFPYGTYLTKEINLKNNVSLYGFDSKTTRIVLHGGALESRALLYGTTENNSLINLSLDGNMDIQVNNVDLIKLDSKNLSIINCILNDGYNIANLTLHGTNFINNVHFGNSVINSLVLKGDGIAIIDNVKFENVSTLKGLYGILLELNNSRITNAVLNTNSITSIKVTGDNNFISASTTNNSGCINTGLNNVINIIGAYYDHAHENVKINNLSISNDTKLNDYFNKITCKSYNGNKTIELLVRGEIDVQEVIEQLKNNIQENGNNLSNLESTLSNEISSLNDIVDTLTRQYNSVDVRVTNEVNTRREKDNELNSKIEQETNARIEKYNELNSNITQETNERTYSCERLQTQINNLNIGLENSTIYPILGREYINDKCVVTDVKYEYGNVLRYGAKGDGQTDDGPAFTNAILCNPSIYVPYATYFIHTPIRIPQKGTLAMQGSYGKKPVIIGDNSVVISRTPSSDNMNTTNYLYLSNICFDGQNIRASWMHSQNHSISKGFSTVFTLSCEHGSKSEAIIENCEFININSLPFALDNFKNVRISKNRFYKCMDIGLRTCENITFTENIIEFSADNGISISRGCQLANISNNIFRDCETNGIYLTGYVLNRTPYQTLTITGTSYSFNSEVTLSLSSPYFSGTHIGQFVTVYDENNNYGVIKITSVAPDYKNAVGKVVYSIPTSIQNTTANKWYIAPLNAPRMINVSNNIVFNCFGSGIVANDSPANMIISNNQLINSGMCRDSEIFSIGSISKNTNKLYLNDTSKFTENDLIMIIGENSYTDIFISKIVSLYTTYANLDTVANSSYVDEKIYLLHIKNETGGHGLSISGYDIGDIKTANMIKICNNIFQGFYETGVTIGTSKATAKNVFVENNIFKEYDYVNTHYLDKRYVIKCSDGKYDRLDNIVIRENNYDGNFPFIFIQKYDSSIRKFTIKNNITPNTSNHLFVKYGNTIDMTNKYLTSYCDGTNDYIDLQYNNYETINVSDTLRINKNISFLIGEENTTIANIIIPNNKAIFKFTLINDSNITITFPRTLFVNVGEDVVLNNGNTINILIKDNKRYLF